jgi:phage tail P2-like protein
MSRSIYQFLSDQDGLFWFYGQAPDAAAVTDSLWNILRQEYNSSGQLLETRIALNTSWEQRTNAVYQVPSTETEAIAPDLSLRDLLPSNASAPERALSLATARIGEIDTPILSLWNPDTCSEALLPWLAWATSVDDWNANWTTATKRNVIKKSAEIHRKKGTVAGVRSLLDSFGIALQIVEWWQTTPKGTPHTFEIALGWLQTPAEVQDSIIKSVAAVKPVRSLFTLSAFETFVGIVNIVGVCRPVTFNRLDCAVTY